MYEISCLKNLKARVNVGDPGMDQQKGQMLRLSIKVSVKK
jgi:hypothetical protein